MNGTGWIVLVGLFAVTVYSIWMTTRAIRLAYASQDEAKAADTRLSKANERMTQAELSVIHLEYALAKEQREHRLLLAKRERKKQVIGTTMSGAGLEIVEAHAPNPTARVTINNADLDSTVNGPVDYANGDSTASARRGRG